MLRSSVNMFTSCWTGLQTRRGFWGRKFIPILFHDRKWLLIFWLKEGKRAPFLYSKKNAIWVSTLLLTLAGIIHKRWNSMQKTKLFNNEQSGKNLQRELGGSRAACQRAVHVHAAPSPPSLLQKPQFKLKVRQQLEVCGVTVLFTCTQNQLRKKKTKQTNTKKTKIK